MVDDISKSVVVSEAAVRPIQSEYFTRVDPAGVVRASGYLESPEIAHYENRSHMMPVYVDGTAVVFCLVGETSAQNASTNERLLNLTTVRVMFDMAKNRELLRRATVYMPTGGAWAFSAPTFVFKEAANCRIFRRSRLAWHVVDLEEMVCKPAELDTLSQHEHESVRPSRESGVAAI